ncbi:type II secretion system protein [Candidatus Nomurabacteria bacterium]|nr:type II secretion system protein [Candidatus Nomurabacteria bacterium]
MKKLSKNKGYTIIETMIAVSLFIVVVMSGMGALLNANLLHNKSRNMRSIMDSLSFAMEDMSKNLRTGYNYRCITSDFANIGTPLSGATCGGVAFEESTEGDIGNDTDQWIYYIGNFVDANGVNKIGVFKSVDGGTSSVRLTPDEVSIDGVTSGISILGAEAPPGNNQQPFITIKMTGNITYKNIVTPFSLQTSVSQRLVDI